MVDERLIHPTRRNERPSWEISVDGRVVGWVHEHMIGRSSTVFYKAIGIAPGGAHINLENSPDRRLQVATVVAFDLDPDLWKGIHWHPR